MTFNELVSALQAHDGEFLCEYSMDRARTRLVPFHHEVTPAVNVADLPDVGDLRAFYATVGSVLFYSDEKREAAARYLAEVSEWAELRHEFNGWIELPGEEEEDGEFMPSWVDSCLVIGEVPFAGNYILIPTEGAEAGQVWEFDHDGFEFYCVANDLAGYIERMLAPGRGLLVNFSSTMHFREEGTPYHWTVRELRDNQGRVVNTKG